MEDTVNLKQTTSQIKYASIGKRILATIIDGVVLTLLSYVINVSLGNNLFQDIFDLKTYQDLEKLQNTQPNNTVSIIGLIIYIAYYFVFYINYHGATPGKRLVAIKVTNEDNSQLTYPTVIVRLFGNLISSLVFGIGYSMAIWDRKKQTLHDKLAKTVVIETEEKPKILLAVFISIVTIITFILYFGMVTYKTIDLVKQKTENDGADTAKTISEFKQNMDPDAKIHYDKSKALFQEIRNNKTEPKKVELINNENISELKQASQLDPKNAEIWNELGNANTWINSVGSLDEGLTAYKKAEEISPNNIIYINNVGDMLIRLERYQEAILQFQKTFRLTNNSGYANLSAANAYLKLGIKDSAIEHYQTAINIFSNENLNGKYDSSILEAKMGMAEASK